MKLSKLDLLISDNGFKGIVTRLIGVTLVYFGMLYLPDGVAWISLHLGTANLSASQLEKHPAVMYVVRIFVGAMFLLEFLKALRLVARQRKGKGE
jgi:hypothetical protein